MSTESPSDIVMTATVCIFSPDMKGIIVVVNNRLNRILPPWWKFDPKKDAIILDTAIRETAEEIRLALFPGTGEFLDRSGNPVDHIEPVEIEDFIFTHDSNMRGRDHLYFFRLHEMVWFDLRGQLQGYFFTKDQIQRERWEIDTVMYPVLFPGIRQAVLQVMQ